MSWTKLEAERLWRRLPHCLEVASGVLSGGWVGGLSGSGALNRHPEGLVGPADRLRHRKEAAAVLVAIILSGSPCIRTDGLMVDLYRRCLRSRGALRMAKRVFLQLCGELQEHCGLRNSKHVGFAEQVAVLLQVSKYSGDLYREIRKRFRRAPGRISVHVSERLP